MRTPARHNVALRHKDVNKCFTIYGGDRPYTHELEEGCVIAACANWLGSTQIHFDLVDSVELPGRPVGIRGIKRGKGRRSEKEAQWKQYGIAWAYEVLKLCGEIWATSHKSEKTPSPALMLYIATRTPPKAPHEWQGKMPKWALKAHLDQVCEAMVPPAEVPDAWDANFQAFLETWHAKQKESV